MIYSTKYYTTDSDHNTFDKQCKRWTMEYLSTA